RADATRRVERGHDVSTRFLRHAEHFARAAAEGRVAPDDLGNVREAVRRFLDRDDPERAAQLVVDGRRVWFFSGALVEVRDWCGRLLEHALSPVTRAR